MRAPDSHEKGAPHAEYFPDVPTADESGRYVNEDALPPLHLSRGTPDAVRQECFSGARDRLLSGVAAGVATTTVGADPTEGSRICHL
jgi:hypothetical protein